MISDGFQRVLGDRRIQNVAVGLGKRCLCETLRVNARRRRLSMAEDFGNALDGRALFEQERRGGVAHGVGAAGSLFAENGRGIVFDKRGELLTLQALPRACETVTAAEQRLGVPCVRRANTGAQIRSDSLLRSGGERDYTGLISLRYAGVQGLLIPEEIWRE